LLFFFSSRRRHTRFSRDWSSDVCSSDLGPVLLVCNHVSFVDALLIGGAVRRPVRFVMYYRIYNLPVLNFIFRTAGTVPIAARGEIGRASCRERRQGSWCAGSGELQPTTS